ncbi:MAG: transporter [Deltaproteobacteria bacterium]|nr:transporter [Deltaproteobacteria bacterium]
MPTETIRKILTRDFILVFFAQFTFIFVYHILIPTLPIYLSRLGSKETEIGVLIGSFSFSSLVLRPFIGRALLRISEKYFMITGALLFALTSLAYLLASPFWPFLVVRIFQGIGLAFFNTAVFTLISNISPGIHRGQSLSYFFLAQNISLALAPSFGMFLIDEFSFTVLFLVCLGVSLFSLFIANKLGRRQVLQLEDSSTEDGFFIHRKVLPSSIISFFFYFIWGALCTFFPLYAIQNEVANPGLFFTAIAIILILGRAFGGKVLDLYRIERVILYFLTLCVISMTILAFSKTLLMFILVGVIWGIGAALLNPAVMAHTLDRAGSYRGPAMGTYTAFSDFGLSLGPVIMGIIIPWTGYSIMFLCLALVGVINLSYFYFFVRKKG